jgi:hypothetical protein
MTGVDMISWEEVRKVLRQKSRCNEMQVRQNTGAREKSGSLFSKVFLLKFHFRQVLLKSV